MDDATVEFIAAIAEHSAGLADAAEGNLDADVQHCPGWSVADLVHHLTTTHWFWATIVEEHLSAPPAESRRPPRASREDLIATCRANADRLVRVLRSANGTDPVYTWAPGQQDIAFITRHQVQEAAVHHWDAVHAIGRDLVIATPVAVDAIDEFLTFSVSSQTDPADPVRPALAGQFALRCSDTSQAWTILDDTIPGTITYEQGIRGAAPEIVATSSALLLWLYERLDLCGPSLTREVVSAAEVATRATVWASANLPKFGMLTEKVHHHAPNRSRTNGNLSPRSKYVSTSTNSCQLFGVLELDDQVDVDGGSVSMPAPHARSREGPLMSV